MATNLPNPLQIGGTEWLWIVLVAAIFLFGSKKIPEIARSLGKAMGEFQRGRAEIERQIRESTHEAAQAAKPFQQGSPPVQAAELQTVGKEDLQKAAAALGIDASTKTEEELRKAIKEKIG